MHKQFKQYLLIFRTNRILFLSVFIISVVSAIVYRQYKPDDYSMRAEVENCGGHNTKWNDMKNDVPKRQPR